MPSTDSKGDEQSMETMETWADRTVGRGSDRPEVYSDLYPFILLGTIIVRELLSNYVGAIAGVGLVGRG